MSARLTPEQQAVIQHTEGHARVRAVAGSGKTTTLVERVVQLLRQGVPPSRLLVVMYNRAAREDFQQKLQHRCAEILREEGLQLLLPDIRTFHSLGHRLTQTFCRWGVLQPRQLQQEDWMVDRLTRQALNQLAEQQGEEAQAWLEEDALEAFKAFCTLVKSGLDEPEQVLERLETGQKHFTAAFEALENLLEEQRLMFFDDLLWRPVRLLQQQPAFINRLQGYLDHLIVDEYQDINEVQQVLLKSLAGQAQVMVVGDVDQCIYEWRGARPEYMLRRFQQDFLQVRDYPLTRTFRFGHGLALAANQAICHNRERPDQLTLAADTSPPTYLQQGQGAEWLLEQLDGWRTTHPQGQAAVLVRSWSQSLDVQLALLKAHKPFSLARQEHFIFNRPQIRGLLAYARLALHSQEGMQINYSHPDAQQDFYQLISFPTLYLSEQERQALLQARIQGKAALSACIERMPAARARRINERLKVLQRLARLATRLQPAAFIRRVLQETDALEQLRKTASSKEAAEEALRLIEGLRRYAEKSAAENLQQWIEELELARQEGIANQSGQQQPGVVILTVHAAKGLEWDWVAVYGLNEGDFPYTSGFSRLTPAEEEAERRLFYVAMTRARHWLLLVRSDATGQPSRFLAEAALEDARQLAACLEVQAETTRPSTLQVRDPALLRRYWQAVSERPLPELQSAPVAESGVS
ncbi:ATP-dependent helicase [Marinospirillum alkaliphilum]|uniref:DNA 3'-5' helicase n=1 Tax=Marinospirillum alkaliphilum DSM 21637 TaxID=1122209 RepID=A0A1K1UGX5_9GAMM|nr:ATP-dependent helicase [Marinospirillum alkaliphilum]SFX12305.1 DNA helicase-2 / ATP-dependent DNA helicase PcrA [Marinospirillum alkaliphilum DSM 21637]